MKPVVTNLSTGLTILGRSGIHSEGTVGGTNRRGRLRIDFDDGKHTVAFFYNNPDKAIPQGGGRYYLHPKLPAYMIKWNGAWMVGTAEQLQGLFQRNRNRSC